MTGVQTCALPISFTRAAEAAHEAGTPWVLDPVGVGGLAWRTSLAADLLQYRPTAIRGNASEIAALAGAGAGGRGVESTDEVDAVLPAAAELARTTGAIVAVSGARDAIVSHIDGADHIARVDGGHSFMPLVIGTGCSLGAVTAAYLAAVPPAGTSSQAGPAGSAAFERFTAVVAAHAHFADAGEAAATGALGPGTYSVHFLDALFTTDDDRIGRARVEVTTV